MSWKALAACKGREHLFFGNKSGQAKKLCAVCVVQPECLDYALTASGNPDGIWGGTTYRERRAMRRERLEIAS